jgi:hypothetical protein
MEAMQLKYLAELQFGIYNGEVTEERRLELYGMTFSYQEGAAKVNLNLHTATHSRMLVKAVKKTKEELQLSIYELIKNLALLPKLPSKWQECH